MAIVCFCDTPCKHSCCQGTAGVVVSCVGSITWHARCHLIRPENSSLAGQLFQCKRKKRTCSCLLTDAYPIMVEIRALPTNAAHSKDLGAKAISVPSHQLSGVFFLISRRTLPSSRLLRFHLGRPDRDCDIRWALANVFESVGTMPVRLFEKSSCWGAGLLRQVVSLPNMSHARDQ